LSAEQFAALRHLSDLVMPPVNGRAGARDAEVAEFLDFLVSKSPADRQALYRDGLDQLNRGARSRLKKPFAELTPSEAAPILAPLTAAWTYNEPADVTARFLRAAKEDILRATSNSRAWAATSPRTRASAGMGSYWHTIE
jgi:hypothetical protein